MNITQSPSDLQERKSKVSLIFSWGGRLTEKKQWSLFGPITLVCGDYQANNWEDCALWFINDSINYFKSVFLGPSATKNNSFIIL